MQVLLTAEDVVVTVDRDNSIPSSQDDSYDDVTGGVKLIAFSPEEIQLAHAGLISIFVKERVLLKDHVVDNVQSQLFGFSTPPGVEARLINGVEGEGSVWGVALWVTDAAEHTVSISVVDFSA